MKVTQEQKKLLAAEGTSDEGYHGVFDDLLEEHLRMCDPEWMKEMEELYEKSGNGRWYA